MTRYVRKGKCLHCGMCCKFGAGINPCMHLKKDLDKYVCGLGDGKPNFCKNYPPDWEHVFEGCGYYFIDTENSDKIMPKIPITIIDGKDVKNERLTIDTKIIQKSEEEKIDYEKIACDPLSVKSIQFAKDLISKIKSQISADNTLESILNSCFNLNDDVKMDRLTYTIALKYIISFSVYGEKVIKWYLNKGYEIIGGF